MYRYVAISLGICISRWCGWRATYRLEIRRCLGQIGSVKAQRMGGRKKKGSDKEFLERGPGGLVFGPLLLGGRVIDDETMPAAI